MYTRKTKVANSEGLHARPASDFIALAAKYKSKVTIMKSGAEDEKVNAKSIVMLLSLGLSKGTEVEIIANGDDEVEAVDALISLIDSKFGE
jgi:phosphocarrier protein